VEIKIERVGRIENRVGCRKLDVKKRVFWHGNKLKKILVARGILRVAVLQSLRKQ
jgi:hypothetical protein